MVFTLELEIEQTAIEGYNIQTSFINKSNPTSAPKVHETPPIDTWDEKSTLEGSVDGSEGSPKKGRKDKKKGADKKGKKRGEKKRPDESEESEEESSTAVVFRQDFGPFRITNDFAEKLCKTTFYVYLVH